MIKKIESAFRSLISALQIATLYGMGHAKFGKYLDQAYQDLRLAFIDTGEIVIGIVGEELAWGKEILFDLSKTLKPMILYLKGRGVERISFGRDVGREELKRFVGFLLLPKDRIPEDPQQYLTDQGVSNISVGKIKVTTAAGDQSLVKSALDAVDYLSLYESSLDSFSQSIDNVLSDKEMDNTGLRLGISNVMESLAGRYQDLLKLTTVKRYDMTTFVHIMNVSILAMYFSSKLGFSKDDILDIGTAALFHDIGKLYISRQIIRKESKLTDAEFARIKSHSVLGAEILLKYTPTLGILPVVVCFEHHLKYDLSGYPKLPFSHVPHTASLIVAICDVYDALLARRSYKASYAPMVIHDIMTGDRGKGFEPQLLDRFFQYMGVWPIGTLVLLNDGRVAVVRAVNEDEIFLPVVEVIHPEKGENIDLRATQDKVYIHQFLDPVQEGKPFLPLV
ncbi:MAG: HD domain-containing phosphohydrolase [Candidatus Omnitrophota bacterium]